MEKRRGRHWRASPGMTSLTNLILQRREAAMPLPKPHKGESQSDFMGRCMHEAYGAGAPEDRTQEQATAMCFSAWREVHGGSAPKAANGECPEPDDDESHAEYMDRCSEDYDEDECQLKWEETRSAGPTGPVGPHGVVHKTHVDNVQ